MRPRLPQGRSVTLSVALVLATPCLVQCTGSNDSGALPPSARQQAGSAAANPGSWLGSGRLAVAGSGSPAATDRFTAGQRPQLTLDVRSLPAQLPVRVRWLTRDGRVIGEETRQGQMGQDFMSFAAPGTGGLDPGQYRVTAVVRDRPVYTADFEVTAQQPGRVATGP